jgi:hypothetical protein
MLYVSLGRHYPITESTGGSKGRLYTRDITKIIILLERGRWCVVQPCRGFQFHVKGRITYGRQYIWTDWNELEHIKQKHMEWLKLYQV